MKDEGKKSSLGDNTVEGDQPILDGLRIVWTMEMLSGPIAWHDAGKLPHEPVDDVRIGIVFNDSRIIAEGNVLSKALGSFGIEDDVAIELGIFRREQHKDTAGDGEKASLLSPLGKDLGLKPGSIGVE